MAFDEVGHGFAINTEINRSDLPLMSFIMSGGSGSRLWPLSRLDRPKQFHNLTGQENLLTATLNRLKAPDALCGTVSVIGAQVHQHLIAEAITAHHQVASGYDPVQILLEPVARNTAAVAAIATASALREAPDVLILLCPADHEISTDEQFWQTIWQGMGAAQNGAIVTFGLLPERPETGYGYVEVGERVENGFTVRRFVEKPDYSTALDYLRQGRFFWNSGIFLFRASSMRQAFLQHAPDIWLAASAAIEAATTEGRVTSLSLQDYSSMPSVAFDVAIMEKADNRVLIPAAFSWSDLGSWQSLLSLQNTRTQPQAGCGNVIIGNVVAHDCHNSYLRSEAGLLTLSGVSDMAVIATKDATFVAPITHSHHVQAIVSRLKQDNRPELYYNKTPPAELDNAPLVRAWLFEKALPFWANAGVEQHYGGFHEALSLQGKPICKSRRCRTMARQIYAFANAGFTGLTAHGLLFLQANGRSSRGGWVQSFHADGTVEDDQENFYDQTCMLLALAYAYKSGHNSSLGLAQQTFAFLDRFLAHPLGGFYERLADCHRSCAVLTSNAHMHYLEACLAWHVISGDEQFLHRAAEVVRLCSQYFFDAEYWGLGEYFSANWRPVSTPKGRYAEPGHHFEWAALLADFAHRTGDDAALLMASRLYTFALSAGTNRKTGLSYNLVTIQGQVLDTGSRSWQQCEAIKAAIMLNGYQGRDLKPEVEVRVANLFRWHIEPATAGLWHDRVDAQGKNCSDNVPASILYHLVSALTCYLQFKEQAGASKSALSASRMALIN